MNKAGLIISAALLYLYAKESKKTEDEEPALLLSPDDVGIDYNDTTMPDAIQDVQTAIHVVAIGKDAVKAKIYLYIPAPKNKKKDDLIYIHEIKVNGYLFGKPFAFYSVLKKEEYAHNGGYWYHTDYSVQFDPSMSIRYSPYGYMFGEGDITGLTAEEIQQIREAIADGKKEVQDFARVDVQILWSRKQQGNPEQKGGRWNKGIILKIPSKLIQAK